MTGIELLAGAAVGYRVRKLRRVGAQADAQVERALDAGLDSVHDLLTEWLGDDPALARLAAQAQSHDGEVDERTLRRVSDAVADAAEANPGFEERLRQLVESLQRREDLSGQPTVTVHQKATASGHGRNYQAGRDMKIGESGQN
ncbi:hypothetical protein [Kitasatospora sp. NPDC087314]|uniref:hypothetical protein n=1 Tax=Kitasatospora sp. NPDC087314 TaxID=3364068 RepID=UPI0038166D38